LTTMPHIIYNQYDVDPAFRQTTWHCATEELPANQAAMQRAGQKITKSQIQQSPQAATIRNLDIAVDCDNDFFKDFKSVFADAQKYAIAVLGAMSDIYGRDANCAIKASFLRVWQTEDPYTGHTTEELLGEFQQADISAERATALLFSGDDALGGGLAYVDVLCINDGRGFAVCGMYNNYTYPTDKYVWDSDVTSHEFGHNVGSLHTHNCDWAPPVDSCVAAEGGCFATPKPRKGTVMSYCHLTPSGTELKLHPRVATFMKQQFASSGCAPFVPVPVATAPADKLVCKQALTPLTGIASNGTPPYSVLWFPATGPIKTGLDTTTLLSVIATPTKTMPYVFRVTDANNVRAYDTVLVSVDTVLVNIGPKSVEVCGVDSILMTPISFSGRGKVTFEWRENASDKLMAKGQTIMLPAKDTMSYKVIATDSIGCSGYDLFTIYPVPGLNATITTSTGSTNFCDNSVELNAGSGFTGYKWSNGATTQKITVSQSGTYSCIVSQGGTECSDTASITIVKNAPPEKAKIALEGNVLKCLMTAVSYQWYKQTNPSAPATRMNNGTAQEYTPIVNGYYHVKTTNEDSCSSRSDTLFVTNVGVEDEPSGTALRIYPNPASKSVTIDAGTGPAVTNLYITDMTGKTIWSAPRMSDQTQTISITKWAVGSYLLHFTAEGNQSTAKFVKE